MTTVNKVRIPEGVKVQVEGRRVKITGPKGTVEREMVSPGIAITCDGKELIISTQSSRKQEIAMCGTFASHARNMCKGVVEGYTYRMKVVYSHFPIQLKVIGSRLEIANFLGEKKARYANLLSGTKVTVGNDEVTVAGIDKEVVGTTVASISQATHIRDRDPRVFQDGIYLVERT
ncbi:MAG: 50S ribosomal protein L6 [Methanomicrobiales archaeon]|nr:50S ribosomal protein L6 [Methanomicrobiales archaeon]